MVDWVNGGVDNYGAGGGVGGDMNDKFILYYFQNHIWTWQQEFSESLMRKQFFSQYNPVISREVLFSYLQCGRDDGSNNSQNSRELEMYSFRKG